MVAIKFFLSAMEAAKLFTSGSLNAPAIVCYRVSSRPGTRTRNCNCGRLRGSLSIGGRDVGAILIWRRAARPYIPAAR
jgi:hypothetical protein